MSEILWTEIFYHQLRPGIVLIRLITADCEKEKLRLTFSDLEQINGEEGVLIVRKWL